MNKLKELADYAISKGAHAPLKKQPDGSLTLFVCVDQTELDYHSPDATAWNHVMTIVEEESKWVVSFSSKESTRLLLEEEVKTIISLWVSNPFSEVGVGYEST